MSVNEEERNDPPFNGPSVVRVVHFINDKVQDEYPQRNERIHPNPFSIVSLIKRARIGTEAPNSDPFMNSRSD